MRYIIYLPNGTLQVEYLGDGIVRLVRCLSLAEGYESVVSTSLCTAEAEGFMQLVSSDQERFVCWVNVVLDMTAQFQTLLAVTAQNVASREQSSDYLLFEAEQGIQELLGRIVRQATREGVAAGDQDDSKGSAGEKFPDQSFLAG